MMRRALLLPVLFLTTAALAQGGPDLSIEASQFGEAVPGLPSTIEIHYSNLSRTVAATETVITLTSTQPFLTVPANCTVSGNQATCSAGTVAPWTGETLPVQVLTVTVRAPEGSEQPFDVTAAISSRETDEVPSNNTDTLTVRTERTIFVTTTADSGPGSLREAIHTANASCNGPFCIIAFRIPNATVPWVTIATETPLPHVTGAGIMIDGGTQTRYFGDTNPLGPEVELTGVAQREGDGVVYRGCTSFYLRHLAVNGFPGSGVLIAATCQHSGANADLWRNYIGTDPTGTRAVRNQRGVYVDGIIATEIVDNVISGNLRSGVYVRRGRANVRGNRIGLTPALAPLGNGASGVYVGAGGFGTDVSDNAIGFNAHWGLAIDAEAALISATGNSLHRNFGLGIDWGHDMGPLSGPLPAPEITSARVENGQTVIEGTLAHLAGPLEHEVHLYANDAPHWTGYGEGQHPLGSVRVSGGTFTFTSAQDLTGKWVTATFTQRIPLGFARSPGENGIRNDVGTTTSEFSRAMEIQ